MIRNATDPTAGEPDGGLTWKRVILDGDLDPLGEVTCTVTVPKTPADPEDPDNTDADWWRETDQKVRNVRNGLPNSDIISAGQAAWIHYYFGRWVIVIPEC